MNYIFPNLDRINKLASIIESQLTPLINSDFVLLDVPNHRNIGDSLIWKGELEYFKKLPFKMLAQYNRNTFNGKKITKDTTILLHGGGNFGDIYSTSQGFRLDILDQYPDNPIIMLPQSVHYINESNMLSDFKQMNKHKKLWICLRDNYSYNLLSKYFNGDKLLLLPDMAFFLDFSKFHTKDDSNRNLYMQRTDAEISGLQDIRKFEMYGFSSGNTEILDWPSYSNNKIINFVTTRGDALESKISKVLKDIPLINNLLDPAYGFKSKNNMDFHVNNGVSFMKNYDKILTTRLHGLILGILLNKEVYILDNSYGKNSKFFSTWLTEFDKLTLLTEKEI